MSAGSDASNFGYANIAPNSNINGQFVNVDNSHNPALFGSYAIPGTYGLPGLSGAKNNIDAAEGYVPNICFFKGGKSKQFKNKIKNILNKYKMSKKNKITIKHKLKRLVNGTIMENKSRLRNRSKPRTRSRTRTRSSSRSRMRTRRGGKKHSCKKKTCKLCIQNMKGGSLSYPLGYSQFQNNLPMTPTYSVGGNLSPQQLGQANPPPYHILSNCTNCVDNYNHFTGKGFASRGH